MYGVPKFKEGFFMRYKKEALLSIGAFLTIASMVKIIPGQTISEVRPIDGDRVVIEEAVQAPIIGYQVVINGTEIGVVADETQIDDLVAKAYLQLKNDLGYDPELEVDPALIPVREGELTLETSTIVDGLREQMYSTLDVVMQKAFVMRIGDDFTVALESEAAVKEVLAAAQAHFVRTDEKAFIIDLSVNEYNNFVMTPRVLMRDPNEVDMNLLTAPKESESEEAAEGESVESMDELEQDKSVKIEGAAGSDEQADTETEETQEEEPEEEIEKETGKMVAIQFAEDIAIVETYVNPEDLVDVEEATELITKENEEEKIYQVQRGDCASTIASANDMSLTDLYKMNPGLKDNEKRIQVGDPIVVMVPEPEIKVETMVEISYTEPIYRSTVKKKDPNTYVGSSKVVDYGSDGVMEVTALVTKLNGEEIDREITDKTVLTEPASKIISVGSKPFPVVGATGTYIFPVSGYRISSPFGYRWGSFHHGVDLALSSGNPIVASDGGTITFAGWKSSTYGYFVEIDHGDGVKTRYAHCSKVMVKVGQKVAKGQQIGKVGSTGRSTGPHVHFEIRFDGTAANPLNYLGKG